MPYPIRLLSLLLTVACTTFAMAQDNKSSKPPVQAKSALLVVDAQVGVLSSVWESERVIGNLVKLVDRARSAGVPVIWVQHSDDDELKYGSQGWRLAPSFVPGNKETVIHKKYNSSFANTNLDQRLRALSITRIVLAGALTNWCVRSTAYAAVDRGYNLALVSDAHSTVSLQHPDGTTVPAESIVADLNSVFEWLSAPNVRTEVRKTADVAF